MKLVKYLIICGLSFFLIGNLSAQNKGKKQKPPKLQNEICQDSITKLNGTIKDLQLQVKNLGKDLQKEQESSKIDNFLNLADTTIFGSKFQKIDVNKLHPQRRDWYSLIENIRELRKLLPPNISVEQLEMLKRNEILEQAQGKIDKINSFDCFDFLSEPQKQYWRELINRYNTYNKYANP